MAKHKIIEVKETVKPVLNKTKKVIKETVKEVVKEVAKPIVKPEPIYKSIQHPEELAFIIEKCKGKKNFIEIGTNEGGTFYELSKVITGKAISIDLEYKGREIFAERNKRLSEDVKGCVLITGDSHCYDVLNKVKNALQGELVDVLMIDGDHSYLGVKSDYLMYKQFVSDGGLIIFHDIITSVFHAQHDCFVDQFWNELQGDKQQLTVSNEWGGVGIITNKRITWDVHQIFYNDNSKKELLPCFKSYDNTAIKNTVFYENDVILDIYKKGVKSDYIGITSWKFAQKTGFSDIEFRQKIEENLGKVDIIMYPPFSHIHEGWVLHNKENKTPLYNACVLIDSLEVLPFKISHYDWVTSYCNYWVAKKEVFNHYVETVLTPIMNAFKTNHELINFCLRNKFKHGGKDITITPFIIEILMGYYITHNNISNVTVTPPHLTVDKMYEIKNGSVASYLVINQPLGKIKPGELIHRIEGSTARALIKHNRIKQIL